MQINTGHFIIRSDLAPCKNVPAIKLRLSLPDPHESLIMQVLPLEDQTSYTSKAEAGVILLKTVQQNLISSPIFSLVNKLVDIARAFAQDLKFFKTPMIGNFIQYVLFKVFFTLTVIVSIFSTVLHLAFVYVQYCFNLRAPIFPKSSP